MVGSETVQSYTSACLNWLLHYPKQYIFLLKHSVSSMISAIGELGENKSFTWIAFDVNIVD